METFLAQILAMFTVVEPEVAGAETCTALCTMDYVTLCDGSTKWSGPSRCSCGGDDAATKLAAGWTRSVDGSCSAPDSGSGDTGGDSSCTAVCTMDYVTLCKGTQRWSGPSSCSCGQTDAGDKRADGWGSCDATTGTTQTSTRTTTPTAARGWSAVGAQHVAGVATQRGDCPTRRGKCHNGFDAALIVTHRKTKEEKTVYASANGRWSTLLTPGWYKVTSNDDGYRCSGSFTVREGKNLKNVKVRCFPNK